MEMGLFHLESMEPLDYLNLRAQFIPYLLIAMKSWRFSLGVYVKF